MKLACIYARCSTEEQTESIPAQQAYLERYATENEYQIVKLYKDDGVSGTSMDRPDLNRLMRDAANGAEWTHVLVWDIARLGRPEDPRAGLLTMFAIEQYGKTIKLLNGTPLTGDPVVDGMLQLVAFGQAGQESIRKSRDVLRGQREAAHRGSNPAGKPPYGYDALYLVDERRSRRIRFQADRSTIDLSTDGTSIREIRPRGCRIGKAKGERLIFVPGDPVAVEIVRRIFREYNLGLSFRVITANLNHDGCLSPLGKKWGRTTLHSILKNPAYKGALAWNRHSWSKFHKARGDGSIERISNPKKKITTNPEEGWVIKEGLWEPLVEKSEWDKANIRLNSVKPSATRGKGASSSFLASGLLRCSCGSSFAGDSSEDKRRSGHRFEYYRCLGTSERRGICDSKRIRRDLIDDYLEHRIIERYLEPANRAAFWREIGLQLDDALATLEVSDPLQHERTRLANVGNQMSRLLDAVAEGIVIKSEVKEKLAALRSEKVDLEARIASVGQSARKPMDRKALHKKVIEACREQIGREADIWPQASPEQRKLIVRAHVAGMVADQHKHTIRTEFYPLLSTASIGIHDTTCL